MRGCARLATLLQSDGDMNDRLSRYAQRLTDALGDDLVGVYLHGSLARGCHNPATSDADIIVVLRDGFTQPDMDLLYQIGQEVGVPIDAVFVTESKLNADVCSTPIAFLAPPRCIEQSHKGSIFLLDRQDAYEAGIALIGPSPKDLIRPVPWEALTSSLDFLFPYIVPRFKNAVLMLCRITYTWTFHKMCSKREAGEWALTACGKEWRPTIETALAEYADGVYTTGIAVETRHAFEEYCAEYIRGQRDLH